MKEQAAAAVLLDPAQWLAAPAMPGPPVLAIVEGWLRLGGRSVRGAFRAAAEVVGALQAIEAARPAAGERLGSEMLTGWAIQAGTARAKERCHRPR